MPDLLNLCCLIFLCVVCLCYLMETKSPQCFLNVCIPHLHCKTFLYQSKFYLDSEKLKIIKNFKIFSYPLPGVYFLKGKLLLQRKSETVLWLNFLSWHMCSLHMSFISSMGCSHYHSGKIYMDQIRSVISNSASFCGGAHLTRWVY